MVAIPQQALLTLPIYTPTDPLFSSVKLLMGFEGANGSQVAPGMADESSAAHGTASVTGATISTSQFKFGASSLSLVQASSQAISFADHVDWHFAAGLFTVEAWIRAAAVAGNQMIIGHFGNAAPNLGWALYLAGAALSWNVSTTGSDNLNDLTGGTVSINTQTAVAIDYDGTTYRLYKDGAVLATSTTARTIFAPNRSLTIGANSDVLGLFFGGFVDEARITKGAARYAGAYTPATSAFPRS